MDVLAETSALNHGEESEVLGRLSTDGAGNENDTQTQEENKFQLAIASWRGELARGGGMHECSC